MPIYEYECRSCKHVFEDLRGFDDPNPKVCPECGADQIRRLISGGNFQLKGTGWYVTDYADSSAPSQQGPPASAAGSDEDGAEDSSSGSDDTDAA